MKNYQVNGFVKVSCRTLVQAASQDEALKIAASRDLSQLAHQAMCDSEEEAWIVDELDGVVENISIEESDEEVEEDNEEIEEEE